MFAFLDLTAAVACNLDYINMTCSDNKTINVTSAYYGQYVTACADEECCIPKPTDCTESMAENHQVDWLILKELCDGENSCSVQTTGGLVQSCVDPYFSEFTEVYYTCLPGKTCTVMYCNRCHRDTKP